MILHYLSLMNKLALIKKIYMKSFVSFLKNTKDSIVDSTQNLFGKKKDEHKDKSDKMEEEDPPESK